MSEHMEAGMYPEELPPQCRTWPGFLTGRRPFSVARRIPLVWHPVLDLTLREAVLVVFYFQTIQPEHMRQSLLYEPESERFCAWPSHLLKDAKKAPDKRRLPLRVSPLDFWQAVLEPLIWGVSKYRWSLRAVWSDLRTLKISWAD